MCHTPRLLAIDVACKCSILRLVSEEKYLENRVSHVERNFSSLATDLGGMVRRTARLRDKGDRIVKTLQDFASSEGGDMKKSLDGMADCFSALEDCNQLKVSGLGFIYHNLGWGGAGCHI